jgi:hypothetical protein
VTGALAAIGITATLAAVLDNASLSDSGAGVITLGPVACTPSGGAAAYSYEWSFSSGGVGMTITTNTASNTTITGNPVGTSQLTGTIICTVTDANGNVVATTGCTLTMQGT